MSGSLKLEYLFDVDTDMPSHGLLTSISEQPRPMVSPLKHLEVNHLHRQQTLDGIAYMLFIHLLESMELLDKCPGGDEGSFAQFVHEQALLVLQDATDKLFDLYRDSEPQRTDEELLRSVSTSTQRAIASGELRAGHPFCRLRTIGGEARCDFLESSRRW